MADNKFDPSVDPAATPAGEPAPASEAPAEAIDPTDYARVIPMVDYTAKVVSRLIGS